MIMGLVPSTPYRQPNAWQHGLEGLRSLEAVFQRGLGQSSGVPCCTSDQLTLIAQGQPVYCDSTCSTSESISYTSGAGSGAAAPITPPSITEITGGVVGTGITAPPPPPPVTATAGTGAGAQGSGSTSVPPGAPVVGPVTPGSGGMSILTAVLIGLGLIVVVKVVTK